jgi:hypothetical protein
MSDIIDINVAQTVEEVTINVVDNVIQVNINQVNGGGGIESVVAGTNITVDNTDPLNPIINANADAVTSVNSDTGAVIVDLQSATDEDNETTNPLKVKLTGTRYSQLDYDGTRIYDDSSEANYLKDSATIIDIPSGKLITYSPTTGISYSKVADFSLLISEIGMSVFKNALNSGYFIGLDSDIPVLRLRNAGMIGTITSENLFFDNVIFKMPSLKEEGEVRTLGTYVNGITAGLDGDIKNIIEKTSSFTAENYICYNANGTLTVTDPTPENDRGYIVHVIGGTTTIGGVGYTTGDLVYRYYDGSSWISTNYNQDLQSVTDNGSNIDGNDIVVKNGLIEVINNAEDKFADFTFDGFAITDDVTADVSAYKLGEISNNSIVYPLPTGATSQIATLLDIPTIDATPTDGSSNAVSSNGVFDALALKETTIFDNVGGSVVNVNSTPTIIYTFPISADTFNNTTLAEISFAIERLGTGSPTSLTVGMYASTSNVTLGNLFASYNNSSTTRLTFSFVRRFKISSNLLDPFKYPVGFGQLSNIGAIATGGTPTTISFNPTVQMYIHIAALHTTVAGDIQVIGSKLTYIK